MKNFCSLKDTIKIMKRYRLGEIFLQSIHLIKDSDPEYIFALSRVGPNQATTFLIDMEGPAWRGCVMPFSLLEEHTLISSSTRMKTWLVVFCG